MRRALLSVSDKVGLVEFAQTLVSQDFEIVSTGGTLAALAAAGISAIPIEEVTHFPEMLDGRVKTLNPRVFGGILARRNNPDHLQTLQEHVIAPIDLVCVNLYPFAKTIAQADVTLTTATEQIDIGGPSLIRAAAKNYQDVLVVCDPADYDQVSQSLIEHTDDLLFRKHLAAKVFHHTAHYDAIIANYLTDEAKPETLTLTYQRKQALRYGENPQQTATFYQADQPVPFSIAAAKQLHGKPLSYNNIKDADAGLGLIREYEEPTVVALKHMNPCGIGTAADLTTAWDKCYAADSMSIFGGIIVLNRPVDLATATKMHHLFLEIIIAPSFDNDAYDVLAKKKNLRLLTVDFTSSQAPEADEVLSVRGGLLRQEPDTVVDDPANFKVVSHAQPTDEQLRAVTFGLKAIKFVKSNAIVVNSATQTLGIGPGQMNRIDAVKIAVGKAETQPDFNQAVLISDAFFPMDDCVEYAAQHGIKVIAEPGGSIRDNDSIAMANAYGVALIFTGNRHFRH
ncbi:bifunctional protein phosphoribosylaminoimidazolecarboxamide formyltransferase imp cyclohydrolase [Levilactobacillus senmaizukei DSM 21775 = NBRC 103853]|uniref:Bifunctional purine biosynthesis protein PurH n=1 Tax=Levilactobacillus senmaizukei DSM 21775 = NBRC 103853 TaxID=1423803 RepID=A0A0R2DG42_9LACO|nr:bifunctional phosphoribosylaminoimidazolecarboxamide formyltransferase/IMP cyclohydrolase [Levilactobacillus senmaizukei]KRN01963.1 bifunctional protein phosphoribosylaminoimidazolecarboxamide formyltransferase imp cyclohydrolase [Levilactobacillus senmaizukei DSM 21775 = NBRC 103853]